MIKIYRLFILYFLFQAVCFEVMAGGDRPPMPQDQIDRIVQSATARAGFVNPRQIITDFNANQARKRAADAQAAVDSYLDKKTIVFSVDTPIWPVGIIKRDLYDIGLMGVNYIIDKLVYDKLQNMRIEHVCNIVLENPEEFENELIKLKSATQKWAENLLLSNQVFANIPVQRMSIEKPLRAYLSKKHKLINLNPFKKELLVPYAVRYIADNMIRDFEAKHLQYHPNLNDFPSYFMDAISGHQPGVAGQRFIISAFTVFRIGKLFFNIKNPYFFWTDAMRNLSVLGSLIKFSMMANVPDNGAVAQNNTFSNRLSNGSLNLIKQICHSPHLPHAINIATIAFSAKIFDDISSAIWSEFVIINKDKLIELLSEYRKEKTISSTSNKTKEAENKLITLIKMGHQRPLNPTWKISRLASRVNLASYTLWPLLTYVGWKSYSFYRSNFN